MKIVVSFLLVAGAFSAPAWAMNPFKICTDLLGFGKAAPVVNYSSENQVDASARCLHFAEAPDYSNYWKRSVNLIAVRDPKFEATRQDAYVVLIMINGSEPVTAALTKRLHKRFGKWVQNATYTGKDGQYHELLALRPAPADSTEMLFEMPVAELMMIQIRDELMNEIQKLQAKNLTGIMYTTRYPAPDDSYWRYRSFDVNSKSEGFGTILSLGSKSGSW